MVVGVVVVVCMLEVKRLNADTAQVVLRVDGAGTAAALEVAAVARL